MSVTAAPVSASNDIDHALRGLAYKRGVYQAYADYYRGNHNLAFATDKFRNAFGKLFGTLADNLCPAVVDAVADRLEVQGVSAQDATPDDAEAAWEEIWLPNRMDRKSGMVHTEALKTGDSYVIVWPDATGAPRFFPQRADQMFVRYDAEEPEVPAFAVKAWVNLDGTARMNLYYPDRIEKYVTKTPVQTVIPITSQALLTGMQYSLPFSAAAFVPFEVPNEPWPLMHDYGRVPVFHFPNNAEMDSFGVSELANVIPLQDALNKTIADMLVAMEFVALPQRWATGLEVDTDDITGKPIVPFTPGVERIWAVEGENVHFGQFDPANLAQFIAVQEGFRSEVARVSKTPLHYMMLGTGDFPSGESMKTAEAPFIAKVRDRQGTFGDVWEDALAFAYLIATGRAVRFEAQWRDPAPRSELEHAQTLVLKRELGVSKKQALKELDYGEDAIDEMLADDATEAQAAADRQAQAFSAGNPAATGGGFANIGGVPQGA